MRAKHTMFTYVLGAVVAASLLAAAAVAEIHRSSGWMMLCYRHDPDVRGSCGSRRKAERERDSHNAQHHGGSRTAHLSRCTRGIA